MSALIRAHTATSYLAGPLNLSKEKMIMPSEQTLSMIKPDGVKRGLIGEVIGRFEKKRPENQGHENAPSHPEPGPGLLRSA